MAQPEELWRITYEMPEGETAVLGVMPESPGAEFTPLALRAPHQVVHELATCDFFAAVDSTKTFDQQDLNEPQRIADRWDVQQGDFNGWPP